MGTRLVKTGDLAAYVEEKLTKSRAIRDDCKVILEHLKDKTMVLSISRKLKEVEGLIEGLEAGYVPVEDTGWVMKTNTKSKWGARMVKAELESMPQEVKETWERVKATGFFDSFSISISRGPDPVLVGNKGRNHFLIGSWFIIADGLAIGFTINKEQAKLR